MLTLRGLASRIVEGKRAHIINIDSLLPIHFHAGDRNAVYLQQSAAVLFCSQGRANTSVSQFEAWLLQQAIVSINFLPDTYENETAAWAEYMWVGLLEYARLCTCWLEASCVQVAV